jgi:hypothetical protein
MKKYILMLVLSSSCLGVPSNHTGVFDLNVKIGDQSFIDILTIESVTNEKQVIGKFEVPNVFIADFKGLLIDRKLLGSFMARERGTEFKVTLKAEFEDQCHLRGELIQNKNVFGVFRGFKRGCDE